MADFDPSRARLVDDPIARPAGGGSKDFDPSRAVEVKATVGDVLKQTGASAIEGIGDIAQAGGELVSGAVNAAYRVGTGGRDGQLIDRVANPLTPVAEGIRESITPGGQAAAADTFQGDITDPSSWRLPETGSGMAMNLGQGIGSAASTAIPVLGAAGRGARAATLIGTLAGGASAGGAASRQVREDFDQQYGGLNDEQLQAAIPAYAEARAKGNSPSDARSIVAGDAALYGGIGAGLAGAAGGAFAGRLLHGVIAERALPAFVGGNIGSRTGRALAAGGIGAAEEGIQETVENMGQIAGQNIGLGVDPTKGITEGSFQNFALGALTGGALGGVGGAVSRGGHAAPNPDEGDATFDSVPEIPQLTDQRGPLERAGNILPAPDTIYVDPIGNAQSVGPNVSTDGGTPQPTQQAQQWVAPTGEFGPGMTEQAPPPAPPLSGEVLPPEPSGPLGRAAVRGIADQRAQGIIVDQNGNAAPGRINTPPQAAPAEQSFGPGMDQQFTNTSRPAPAPLQLQDQREQGFQVDAQGNIQQAPLQRQQQAEQLPGGPGMDQQATTQARPTAERVELAVRQAIDTGAEIDPQALAQSIGSTRGRVQSTLRGIQAENAAMAQPFKSVPAAKKAIAQALRPSDLEITKGAEPRTWIVQRKAPPPTISEAVDTAATSPLNDLPEPTPAQIEAGNYKMAHAKVAGMDATIEIPSGGIRRGTSPDGQPWERELGSHYGYFKRTKGADGENIDAYFGPLSDDQEPGFFVVDQKGRDGKFDEHKVMVGYPDQASAEQAYLENYPEGWDGMGAITPMTNEQFKGWMKSGDMKVPAAEAVAQQAQQQEQQQSQQQAPAPEADASQGVAQAEQQQAEKQPTVQQMKRRARELSDEASALRLDRRLDEANERMLERGQLLEQVARAEGEEPTKARTRSTSEYKERVESDRKSAAEKKPERMYQVVAVNERTGKKEYVSFGKPMTQDQAIKYRDRFNQDVAGRRLQLEEVTADNPSPGGEPKGKGERSDGGKNRISPKAAEKNVAVDQVKAVADALNAAGVPVVSVSDESGLPKAIRDEIQRTGLTGRIPGIYYDGKAYLVASNIESPEHALRTALHEVIGHAGVSKVLGERMDKVMTGIYDSIPERARRELEGRYASKIKGLDQKAKKIEIAEEYVAHLAEHNPSHPTIRRIVALIRDWIRRTFGDSALKNWSSDDIINLLAQSRSAVTARNGGIARPEPSTDRFSVVPDSDLFIAHNMSQESLRHALELGGLAAPSLGISRTTTGGFDGYGDISLIAPKEIINDRDARTFNSDIYSPRHPRATNKVDRKAFAKMEKSLESTPKYLRRPDVDRVESDGAVEIGNSDAVKMQFLQERGIAPKLPKIKLDSGTKKALAVAQKSKMNTVYQLRDNPAFISAAKAQADQQLDAIREAKPDRAARYESFWHNEDGSVKSEFVTEVAHKVVNYLNTDGVAVSELRNALGEKLRNKKLANEFDQYVNRLADDVIESRLLRVGNKFKPYNLENVTAEMLRAGLQGGENWNYGAGSIRAKYAAEMKSIDAVKKRRYEIISGSDFEAVKKESQDKLFETLQALKPFYKFDAESWGYMDDASSAIGEGSKGLNEAFRMTPEARRLVDGYIDYVRNLPTEYFELKMRRPMRLNEFSHAIVPKGAAPDVVDGLKANGIKVSTYDREAPGDRVRALNKLKGVRFSLAAPRVEESFDMAALAGLSPQARSSGAVARYAERLWNDMGTDSPFFKAWFGDSKAKTKSGKPVVFYHGTYTAFDAFDMDRAGDSTGFAASGLGIFLTPDRAQAAKYGDEVKSMYVKLENPYRMGVDESASFETVAAAKAFRKGLERAGYDGIYIPANKTAVVFSPEQVKSTSNRGTFSSDTSDMRFSINDQPTSLRNGDEVPQTGQPVNYYYAKNTEKAPNFGALYGQDIEPAGDYMLVSDNPFPEAGSNWEHGAISFQNPLAIYAPEGTVAWKKELSAQYGGKTGKALSKAITKDGYDAIITYDRHGLSETISLGPQRQQGAVPEQAEQERAATQTDTPAFKKWFGDSKVVDENGDPLVVYHGSPVSGAADEAILKSGVEGGIFFAGDTYAANHYAFANGRINFSRPGSPQPAANVIPAYLSIQNPMEVDFGGRPKERGFDSLIERAKESGHDGVIARNIIDRPVENMDDYAPGDVYIAFRPEQVKSAVGNNGDFSIDNPDIRFSVNGAAGDLFNNLTGRGEVKFPGHVSQGQRDALGKIGAFARKESIGSTINKLTDRWKAKAVQGIFDQYRPLADLDMTSYMQARLSKGTDGALEAAFMLGKPALKDGALSVNPDGEGLRGVLADLNGEHDLFFSWIAGNRAAKLAAEGRENLFTPEDIKQLKSLSAGKMDDGRNREQVYRRALAKFNGYQKSVMDIAEQAGLIDGKSRGLWENEFYVPFYRVMEEDNGIAGPGQIGGLTGQRAFQKLKGGQEPLGDLMSNTLANWSHLLSASMKNLAAQNAIKAAEPLGVATPLKAAEKGSIRIMRDGKEKHYAVNDPLVLDALTMLHHPSWNNPAMKAMTKLKHALTAGVTSSPAFRARNLLRDTISAVAANDLSYNPLKNVVEGWKATAEDSPIFAELLAGGGAVRFGALNDGDQAAHAKQLIKDLKVDPNQILNTPEKIGRGLRQLWRGYQALGDRLETVQRGALYEKLRKEGKSHLEASYAARDVMDFTSAGKWASVRFLTQVVPFLNARLQGMYKLGRAGMTDPRRMLAVSGAVAMASVLLYLFNRDDDEYKQLPDWVRDTYWWMKIPGTEKALYIPKPFEVGVIGSVAERAMELAMSGNDYQARDFARTVGGLMMDQLSMNPMPQAFKPALEAAFNWDSFRGRAIDSMGQERLPAEERYTSGTAAPAVALGQLMGVSPQRIEHMVRGYFGWVGTQALNAADYMVRPFTGQASSPRRDLSQPDNWTLYGDFVKPTDAGAGKYLDRFYQMQHQVDQVYASASDARKGGDIERYRELSAEDKFKVRPIYVTAGRQISEINRRIKAIANDPTMSNDAKRELTKSLNDTRNKIAQNVDERARAILE